MNMTRANGKRYCVYVHTVPDGRKYIGITSLRPEQRWQNGNGYKNKYDPENSSWFYRHGISIFGWENIEHEIVQTGLTKEEAVKMEEELIREYHTYMPAFGFNDKLGSRTAAYPVRCVDEHVVFPNARECADYLGDISAGAIYEACKKATYPEVKRGEPARNGSPAKAKKHSFEFAFEAKEGDIFPND